MYEHSCLDCGHIWWDSKFTPDGCPNCKIGFSHKPIEIEGYEIVNITTNYVD